MARGLIDRALRLGEAKQFKEYEKRVEAINRIEPEMELLEDAEIRTAADELRERARNGESLDDLLPEAFALGPRGGPADARPAPLRRPADRRHGAPRRGDRRDEDRRGQDPDRDAGRLPQHARRRRRPRRHGQRLPGPPRRRVDGADLRARSASPSASSRTTTDPIDEARSSLRCRRHLRHQLRVRLRLPARQHGRLELEQLRPARPQIRDRRRGRQHPDRRGADAADHLRRPRAGRRPLLHVRPPRQAASRARSRSRS